jgi:hypothetical protein
VRLALGAGFGRRGDLKKGTFLPEGSSGVARTIAIWVFGLLASAIFGGLVADRFLSSGSSEAGVWGFLGGIFAFACLRLWMNAHPRDQKPEKYASNFTTREGQPPDIATLQAGKGGQQRVTSLKRWALPVLFIIGSALYGVWSATYGPRYEENLKKLESEQKSKLPVRVDAETTWVDLKFENKKNTYWYVLDYDAVDLPKLRQQVQNSACSNPEVLRTIKEKGFTYEFQYASKKGAPLATITVASCP